MLANSADDQHAYLMQLLWNKPSYGNDELVLEFEDIFCAAGHMLEWNEISQDEIDAIKPLDEMLHKLCGKGNSDFWKREALWSDSRWEEVRKLAQKVLRSLPDEERTSDWEGNHQP